MKIPALVIVLAGFAMPLLAIPKPFNKIDKAAVALFDASAKKYAAAQTISTTFLATEEDGVHKFVLNVRRPGDFHFQNGDGSTHVLFTDDYGWKSNKEGFYWRRFYFKNWEKYLSLSSKPMSDWLFALVSRTNVLKLIVEGGSDGLEGRDRAVSLLKAQTIRGIPCVGFRARKWTHGLSNGIVMYSQWDVWLRADNQTLWAVRGFTFVPNHVGEPKHKEKFPVQFDVLDTRFDLPLKDDVFVYRLPKGQHDWVKDTATPFWNPDLHLKEAAPRLMTYDGQDIYEPNEARTTPLLLWIGLPADEKEALPDVERLANQWGGPKCEVRAVLLGGQVQWLHNGGHRDDEKRNLNVKYDRDFNHSLVAKTLGLKKVPFLLVIDRDSKVAALNPDEKKLGEILPKLMGKSEK